MNRIKILESNEDILLYDIGHIEGAIKIDWETELLSKQVSYTGEELATAEKLTKTVNCSCGRVEGRERARGSKGAVGHGGLHLGNCYD